MTSISRNVVERIHVYRTGIYRNFLIIYVRTRSLQDHMFSGYYQLFTCECVCVFSGFGSDKWLVGPVSMHYFHGLCIQNLISRTRKLIN